VGASIRWDVGWLFKAKRFHCRGVIPPTEIPKALEQRLRIPTQEVGLTTHGFFQKSKQGPGWPLYKFRRSCGREVIDKLRYGAGLNACFKVTQVRQ
jgi:hypothetical protein